MYHRSDEVRRITEKDFDLTSAQENYATTARRVKCRSIDIKRAVSTRCIIEHRAIHNRARYGA